MLRLRVLSALAAVLIAGCDHDATSADSEGRIVGTLDGSRWVGTVSVRASEGTLMVYTRRDRPDQAIMVQVPFTGPGEYRIAAGAGEYNEIVGGDVVSYTAKATGGTVRVAAYDARSGQITASLQVTAAGTRGTTRFTSGKFSVRAEFPTD